MTHEIEQPIIEQQPENIPTEADATPEQPKKSHRNLWILIGVIVIAVLVCICSITCAGLFGSSIFQVLATIKSSHLRPSQLRLSLVQ